jgi:hypothetical protein
MVLTFHNEGYFNVVVSMILETWTDGWLNDAVDVGVVLVTVVAMVVDDDDVVVDGVGGDGVVDAVVVEVVDEVPVLVAVVVGVPLLQKQVN